MPANKRHVAEGKEIYAGRHAGAKPARSSLIVAVAADQAVYARARCRTIIPPIPAPIVLCAAIGRGDALKERKSLPQPNAFDHQQVENICDSSVCSPAPLGLACPLFHRPCRANNSNATVAQNRAAAKTSHRLILLCNALPQAYETFLRQRPRVPPALATGGSFPGAISSLLSVDAPVHGNVNISHNSIVSLCRCIVSKDMADHFRQN